MRQKMFFYQFNAQKKIEAYVCVYTANNHRLIGDSVNDCMQPSSANKSANI